MGEFEVAIRVEQIVLGALYWGFRLEGERRTLFSLTNFYALEYLPAIAQVPEPESTCRALLEHVARERPRWHALRLSMMPAQAAATQWTLRQLGGFGFRLHLFFQYENWYALCTEEGFESYYAKRPSQLRNTIARRQKKLERAHSFRVQIVRDASPELNGMVSDFVAVYGTSWKQPEPYPDFIPALAGQCAALGILRLGVLYVDAAPAAAQLWITANRKATIYKLAYDEKYAEFGVGSILSRELFRIAMDEDRVTEIDYGVGSEPYKKDWMSSVRRIEGVHALNSHTAMGLIWGAIETAKAALKPWLGAGPQRPAEPAP